MSPAERMDLLRRCDALPNFNGAELERRLGLPKKFFVNARLGSYATARSDKAWQRLRAALVYLEKGEPLPESLEGLPVGPTASEAASGLAEAIDKANSPEACNELANRIGKAMADGGIEIALGKALVELLREKRQLLEDILERQERARAGEGVTVEVRSVADWQAKGPCPYCKGTGAIG